MAGKVEFLFDGVSIQVADNELFPLSLERSIADLRDIGKGKGSLSKTYKVPATKANNKAFQHLYDENVKQNETAVQSVKAKVDSEILVDSFPIFRGYSRINSAFKDRQPTDYEVTMFSDNSDWISKIKGKFLNELSFGTATYTKSAIQTVQALAYPTTDFQYPLINYGSFSHVDGCGTEDFRPAAYMNALIQKIFNGVGYTVSSKWLTESDIQSIILANTRSDWFHKDSIIDARFVGLSEVFGQSYAGNPTFVFDRFVLDFDTITSDASAQILPGQSVVLYSRTQTGTKFTANKSGRFVFSGSLILHNTGGSGYGVLLNLFNSTRGTHSEIFFGTSLSAGQTETYEFDGTEIYIQAGDECFMYFDSNEALDLDGTSTLDISMANDIIVGTVFDVGGTLPNMEQLEFIGDLKRIFNLYIEADPLTMVVKVEPRNVWRNTANSEANGYYNTEANAVDWTSKLDESKAREIEIISTLKKTLEFGYKSDGGDAVVKDRNEGRTIPFAAERIDLEERFPEGVDKRHTKHFASTWHEYSSRLNDLGTRVLVPALFDIDQTTPQDKTFDFAPRLLSYKRTNEANRYGETVTLKFYEDTGAAPASEETYIPKAFFVNYDTQADFQLSFSSIGTGKGLFDRFFYSTIPELNDGRILKANFWLKPKDFAISLNTLVCVSGIYYTINKISGFKPLSDALTKVELIPRNEWNDTAITASADESAKRQGVGLIDSFDLQIFTENADGELVGLFSTDANGNVAPVLLNPNAPNAKKTIPFANNG